MCKYGVEELQSKVSTINNNIRTDIYMNLDQLKDIHKKKIQDLNSRFKDDISIKVQRWYNVESKIGKIKVNNQGGN